MARTTKAILEQQVAQLQAALAEANETIAAVTAERDEALATVAKAEGVALPERRPVR